MGDYTNESTYWCDVFSNRRYTPFHYEEYKRNFPLAYLNQCQNAVARTNEYINDLYKLNMMNLSEDAIRKRDEYLSNINMITNSIARSPYATPEMLNQVYPSVPVKFMFKTNSKLKRKSPKRKSPKRK